ncbi:MAG: ATP synthase F0 subunit B [Candidatus Dadabacteria bacterium]|nr:ATP synthase F0 subunit B [Candidatus Dadabacteria bacterium]
MKYTLLFLLFAFFAIVFALAGAAHASDNVLFPDKTIVIQIVIFAISVFILNALIFKPMLELTEKREQLTVGTVKEASELAAKTAQLIEEYETKINKARAEVFGQREELRRATQAEASKIIQKIRNEAQALLEQERVKLAGKVREMKEQIKPEIELLARRVASEIVGREV